MNYTYAKEGSKITAKFTLTHDEWENAITKAYEKTKNKFKIHGFRPGKAPRKIIESMYGKGVFLDEAVNISFSEAYNEFLQKEKEIVPVCQPDVELEELGEEEVKFSCTVFVKPEVTLGKYRGVEVEMEALVVTDNEVTAEINKELQKLAREVQITDRAAQNGDIVIIDYSGSIDGVVFEGGTAEKQPLELGKGRFIPGFEEQIVGMEIGSERDINVKFPENYHEELKNKDAVFHIKLHEIKIMQLPELNDELVKDISAFDSVADYTVDVKKTITENKQKAYNSKFENSLFEAVVANAEVDVNQPMIDEQLHYMLHDFEHRLRHSGMNLKDYFKYTNTTEEDFNRERAEEAKKHVKTRLVIEEIIKQEKLEVTEEELNEKVKQVAEQEKTTPELFKRNNPRDVAYFRNDLLMDKLVALLKKDAVILTKHKTELPSDKKPKKKANKE